MLKTGTCTIKKVTIIGMFLALNHFCTIYGSRDISGWNLVSNHPYCNSEEMDKVLLPSSASTSTTT